MDRRKEESGSLTLLASHGYAGYAAGKNMQYLPFSGVPTGPSITLASNATRPYTSSTDDSAIPCPSSTKKMSRRTGCQDTGWQYCLLTFTLLSASKWITSNVFQIRPADVCIRHATRQPGERVLLQQPRGLRVPHPLRPLQPQLLPVQRPPHALMATLLSGITSVVPLFHLDQSFIIVSITPG